MAARFDIAMMDGERSAISNAIWLCRNCHKMVDGDPIRFPAELLFEWRRSHERGIAESLGKAGAELRWKINERRLAGFEHCSYLAQQIVLDKPEYWEYRLTAEILRGFFEPVRYRWEALKNGLYALPINVLAKDRYFDWHRSQMGMLEGQTSALNNLINGAVQKSWGASGSPGSEVDILRVCTLLRDAAERIVQWEEAVRFAQAPEEFEDLKDVLVGIAGANIEKVFGIPDWFIGIFDQDEDPSGTYVMEITFDWPDRWVDQHNAALRKASRAILGH